GRSQRSDHGLSAADIALHQAQHRRGEREIPLDIAQHAPLRLGRLKRQRGQQPRFQRAVARQGPPRVALYPLPKQFERQLVGQQFLEREAPLRRVTPFEQQIHRRIRRWPVHVLQRFAQRGQARISEYRRGQPIGQIAGGGLIQRQPDQLAQSSLSNAFGEGIDRCEVFFVDVHGLRTDAPILRMHHFQTVGASARFAEAAYPDAPRQTVVLLRREIKESQRQKSGPVAYSAKHLAPAAKHNLREQYLAFHRRPLSGLEFSQQRHAGAVLVTQRQQEQQILGGF